MASDLSKPDLLVIQIDGLHIGNWCCSLPWESMEKATAIRSRSTTK